jgi:transposase-like protein
MTMRTITRGIAKKTPNPGAAADFAYTAADLSREFPNDDACLEYIKEQRWPNSVARCEKCNIERKHYRVTGRKAYACNHCGNHIYPLKGTLFARSATSLKTWFYVMHLMASAGSRITAKRVQRETSVTYKTAWRTLRQLRQVIVSEELQSAHSMKEIGGANDLSVRHDQGLPIAPRPDMDAAAGTLG